ncbi:MAG: STAS domain-containing protein [Pseudomonadota bacterium]
MNIRKQRFGTGVVVLDVLEDRLDAAVAEDFRSSVLAAIEEGAGKLVINLGNVAFMDSSGLGALVGCLRHVGAEGSIVLSSVTRPVERVLRLTRINRVFEVFEDTAAAIQASAPAHS